MKAGPKPPPTGSLDLTRLPPITAGAARVIAFIETYCRLTAGSRAGQRVVLAPFQLAIVQGLYGDAKTPRKRFGYLSLPRKNSKSLQRSETACQLAKAASIATNSDSPGVAALPAASTE